MRSGVAVGFLGGNFEGNDGILVPLDFKNSICFGQTGSGKTTGYILPNIQSRLYLGHSVVIFDYKGNLHAHVKKLANECGRLSDVVEIGPIWG
ncbi:MAG: type IV secretory system conjugative DNA transfer family protein, partial [Helicobacter sp.]|nr:type IV secretory system conjugative DNA transfer family protein [Helicobacter sp.]